MPDDELEDDDQAPPTDAEEDAEIAGALADAEVDFDKELEELFKSEPKALKKLRTVGAFIMRGSSLRESCILARLNYEKFEQLMERYPTINDFIVWKQTAYKSSLLTTLTSSATTGRKTKPAGYLLENQFRHEFGKKNKDDKERPTDALDRALEHVRENGDSTPLVVRTLPPGSVRQSA